MQTWRKLHIGSMLVLFAAIFLLFWVSDFVVTRNCLIGGALIMLGLFVWSGYKERTLQNRERAAQSQETLIRTLSYHRHDWMNDIQVLSGYAKLKKYEQLSQFIDKLRDRTIRESMLSKLHIDSLQMFFLTYRVHHNNMHVNVDLQEQLNLSELTSEPEAFSNLVQDVVNAFHDSAELSAMESNELNVAFRSDGDEQRLVAVFEYKGEYSEQLRPKLEQLSRIYRSVGDFRFEPEQTGQTERMAANLNVIIKI